LHLAKNFVVLNLGRALLAVLLERHAEVRIDDTILMLGQFKDSGSAAHVHVYVPDVGHSFELAKKAGGRSVQEPVKKDDPDLRGGIVDPSGTTWWLSTREE
jgi:uncharacterized glyoxalase superfamily protein PhnB